MLVTEKFRKIKYIVPTFQLLAWSGFTNQPANDDVQVVSNSASDVGKVTLWGIDNSDNLQYHTVTLNGITAVDSVLVPKWKTVYGAFMGDVYGRNIKAAVGTITLKEKSGGLAITTIAAGNISTGMVGFILPGLSVEFINVSGNLYLYPNAACTTANGYPFAAAEHFQIVGDISFDTLISDGSGATAKIVVYEE